MMKIIYSCRFFIDKLPTIRVITINRPLLSQVQSYYNISLITLIFKHQAYLDLKFNATTAVEKDDA
jgi:hypothetical protein